MIEQIKKELRTGASVDIVARRLDIPVHWVLEVLEIEETLENARERPGLGSVAAWPFEEGFNYD